MAHPVIVQRYRGARTANPRRVRLGLAPPPVMRSPAASHFHELDTSNDTSVQQRRRRRVHDKRAQEAGKRAREMCTAGPVALRIWRTGPYCEL